MGPRPTNLIQNGRRKRGFGWHRQLNYARRSGRRTRDKAAERAMTALARLTRPYRLLVTDTLSKRALRTT